MSGEFPWGTAPPAAPVGAATYHSPYHHTPSHGAARAGSRSRRALRPARASHLDQSRSPRPPARRIPVATPQGTETNRPVTGNRPHAVRNRSYRAPPVARRMRRRAVARAPRPARGPSCGHARAGPRVRLITRAAMGAGHCRDQGVALFHVVGIIKHD